MDSLHPTSARARSAFALALAAAAALLVSTLDAQPTATGTVEGRVSNPRTAEYVENARITVAGTALEAFTDAAGAYRLVNVPAGPQRLTVFYTGFPPQTATVAVAPGATVSLEFSLGPAGETSGLRTTGDTVKLDQFVVAVAREMDAAAVAINEQRFAANVKTVVSTDEFGSVAESNIGEFLKFMPGLTIDYNAGNPREVSLNGVPTGNVPITIDGFNVASTGVGATGRAVSLDFLSINNASRIEVVYSPTPESQGAALAGSVNVVPRGSFGRSRPVFNGSVYLAMRDNERAFHRTPGPRATPTRKVRPGADFSWVVPVNPRFGFTLTAGTSEIYSCLDATQNTYRGVSAATNGTTFPHTTVDRPYLSQFFVRLSTTILERRSFGVTLDYKLSPVDRLTFSYQWSSFSSNYMTRTLTFNVNRVVAFTPTSVQGGAGAGSLVINNENGSDRLNRTYMPSLVWRHEGTVWKAEAGAGMSYATNHVRGADKGFFNLLTAQRTGVTVSFEDIFYLRPNVITVTDGATGAPVDPYKISTYVLTSGTAQRRNPIDAQNTAYANLRRDLPGPVPLTLKAGLDARHLTRQYRNHGLRYDYVGRDGRASTNPAAGDDSAAPFLDADFSRRGAPFGFPRIDWVSPELTWEATVTNPSYFVPDFNGAYRTLMTTSKRAEELISSAYLRSDAAFFDRRLKLVGGVRAEQTNIEAHAVLTDPSRNVQRDAAGRPILGTSGRPLPITTDLLQTARLTILERAARTDKEFLTLFPSLNASYAVRSNLIARVAVYRSIGRPDLGQYASGITLPDTDAAPSASNRIVVNNAGIKPWTANSLTARLEYYFEGVGQISIGAFRRDFKNFFGATTLDTTPEFLALYSLDPAVYAAYDTSTQENLPGTVRMTGVDFQYKQALTFLPSWARGVQVFANGSALRATGPNLTNFTGMNLIPRSGSWGVSLTRQRYNLRLNWSYRGRQRENLVATGQGIEPGTYNWTAKRLSVDLLGEYYFRRGTALFANLRNLRDQPLDTKAAGPNTPKYAQFRGRTQNGAVWSFGVKTTF
ncbi:MAG: carboxypeptidase regulatory-like domain-containing protein [Verrucomicrobia bacterium]|nr:carboxypeptidase regulatory-like domain-containing protein [Verrucomicrobiota bacterium]